MTNLNTFPADQIKSAPLVSIFDADQLLQPVTGTSNGSRYLFLGINSDGLRASVKISGSSMTFRVECPPGKAPSLAALWMAALELPADPEKLNKNYQSLHVTCKSSVIKVKTIASLLSVFGLVTTPPNPTEVVLAF